MNYKQLDLTQPVEVNPKALVGLLQDTPLEGLATSFVVAGRKHFLNVIYLLAHAIYESDFGRSELALAHKDLFHVGQIEFSSYQHGIDYSAGLLKSAYLTQGGIYFNGTTLETLKYRTDPRWADGVATWMRILYVQIG